MFKKILLCLALLLPITFVRAEVDVPKECRVHNYPTGCCAWCAIEDLGNVHGVKALEGLAKRRNDRANEKVWVEGSVFFHPQFGWVQSQGYWTTRNDAHAHPSDVQEELDRLGVRYWLQDESTHDTSILREAMSKNLGCAVGVRDWPNKGDYHMVTLTHWDDEKIVFIENLGDCERYEGTRAWFDRHWSGFTVIIYPAKKR